MMHLDLKYDFTNAQSLLLVHTLLTLYETKKLSIPFKVKVLNLLHKYCVLFLISFLLI